MAKTLYFRRDVNDQAATIHRGNNDAMLNGVTSWWAAHALTEVRGTLGTAGSTATTVVGPTNGIEVQHGGLVLPIEWITEPLSADFTISGSITFNLWAVENVTATNAAINVIIEVIDGATGTLTQIIKTTRTTEAASGTSAVNNFSESPTSTPCKRGDRLRVRIFADDSVAATMAVGTMVFRYGSTSAGIDGDSYLTFTEDLTFEPAGNPGAVVDDFSSSGGTNTNIGPSGVGAAEQTFIAKGSTLSEVRVTLLKNNTPDGNLVIEIQSDAAGVPSGTVIGTVATVTPASLTSSLVTYTYACSISLTPSTTYHLVIRSLATLGSLNYYGVGSSNTVLSEGGGRRLFTTSWGVAATNSITYRLTYPYPVSTYYLTDTAETINVGSAIEKKALTTRGSGSVNSITNTANGPTNAIQITDSAGGTAIEWYTPALSAFTLGGKAKFNIRGLESSASANASIKADISICDNNGSNPVVWGTADVEAIQTYGLVGEINTSDTTYVAWPSGDDATVHAGDRLRFRICVDDSATGPLVTAFTVTVSYNGASASAAGDTYVILPQAVTEDPSYFKGGGGVLG